MTKDEVLARAREAGNILAKRAAAAMAQIRANVDSVSDTKMRDSLRRELGPPFEQTESGAN
jgi:hypothetical protein